MERGDYVLCVYDSTYHYVAQVLAKHDNRELAEAVWGTNEQGQTWQLMYFLTEPREIDLPLSELANHLHRRYQGFTRISDERLDAIAEEYGSVEEFVDQVVNKGVNSDNESALKAVLSWIRNLRTQVSPDGRFYYKPLLLLSLLDVLDANPEHSNSFGYEELLKTLEKLAADRESAVTEPQFSQPYVRS
jgi:hypothetical protein